jgi:iron(III) transport system substrate-binding protein
MMPTMRLLCTRTISAALVLVMTACQLGSPARSVVVYTSVDQVYAEPILQRFAQRSGIRVLPVFDVEAAKTTGLVNRLLAERQRPQADVWWSSEFAQTIQLAEQGVLATYDSARRTDLAADYQDPDGYWTGLAGRARVMLVNTDLVLPERYPRSIFDLLDPAWPADRIGLAYPLFGTTATQAAALYAQLGPDAARNFYTQLRARGVRVVDGNSVVRDLVANGQLMVGLTDSDDACGALRERAPVEVIFPDQDSIGTLIMIGTVGLVAGAPHPEEGRALIDGLLNAETERDLVAAGFSQVPLRPIVDQLPCLPANPVRTMGVGYRAIFEELGRSSQELTEVFVR